MITSLEIWNRISDAIQTHHTVRLSYVKKAGVLVGHEVVPLDIWVKIRADGRRVEYLFGHRLDFSRWEEGKRTERQFLLDRILSLQVTDHRFNPADFLDVARRQPRWLIARKWGEAA
jgi:predicted DNA-binding transcriptional regulator YafY